jgi:rifampicin phosphotransferase
MSPSTLLNRKSNLACSLDEAQAVGLVGNKAHNLHRIMRLGLQVPPGFVVTNAAFQLFCELNDLDCTTESKPISDDLAIPQTILDEVLELRCMLLPRGPVVIRSSAVGEDGEEASFAGQLDSILHVETDDDIQHALLACWSSYWSDRVISYQELKRVRLRGMGVIVQTQARSCVSGVLFTRAPGSNGSADICVEYCSGFGDALVSGRTNPGRFQIGRTDGRVVIDEPGDDFPFSEAHIKSLRHSAELLEEYFGGPQDIEWTIDDRQQLVLLQSRPITTFASEASASILWSNANVNENFPGPITPFLYSVAREGFYHYFRNLAITFGLSDRRVRAMEDSLRCIVGVHHARLYYNLTSIHSVLRMAPFGETLADFFNDFVGADAKSPRIDLDQTPRWLQALELCRVALKTSWQYAFLTRRVEEFEGVVDAFDRATVSSELERRSLLSLRDDLRRFMDIRCHRWTNASLADAAAMTCYGVLKSLLRHAYPDPKDATAHNNLLRRVGGVVSVQPAIELAKLSRKILADPETAAWFIHADNSTILCDTETTRDWLRSDLEAYIDRWGFRFSGELMLTVASFQEDPSPLIDMLKAHVKTAVANRTSEETTLADAPALHKTPLVRLVLRATQKAIQLRERARSKQALLYTRCRRIALAIGKRLTASGTLTAPDDIFFLTYQELDELLSGLAMFGGIAAETIASRKRAHHAASRSVAPDTFRMKEGEYRNAEIPEKSGYSTAASALAGTGVCGGKVTSRAAVLAGLSDAHLLQAGDILVTRQTDPGWAPVFSLIRGLVIERGGMLSHGAIIAREFGLPCIVGVRDAAARIPHGCTVSMDGDRGHVQILD